MAIKSLFIINKSGGLIYQRDFLPLLHSKMSSNEYLILAGTLHGVIAIASQLTPKVLQVSSDSSESSSAKDKTAREDINTPSSEPIGTLTNGMDPADHVITYEPGMITESMTSTTPGQPNGSYLALDYFPENFMSCNKSGMKSIVTNDFSVFIYQTLTGIKFVLVSTQQNTSNRALKLAENILRKVYCIYSDYVVKNPFYSADMVIRNELFDVKLQKLVSSLW